jgi:hypothetical protein
VNLLFKPHWEAYTAPPVDQIFQQYFGSEVVQYTAAHTTDSNIAIVSHAVMPISAKNFIKFNPGTMRLIGAFLSPPLPWKRGSGEKIGEFYNAVA